VTSRKPCSAREEGGRQSERGKSKRRRGWGVGLTGTEEGGLLNHALRAPLGFSEVRILKGLRKDFLEVRSLKGL
jgi:hypothetical protein